MEQPKAFTAASRGTVVGRRALGTVRLPAWFMLELLALAAIVGAVIALWLS